MARLTFDRRRIALIGGAAASALVLVTLVVAVLESRVSVPDASAAYLLAVVAMAVVFGTTPAILTAIGAFLIYDFLFTEPRFTFTVHDAGEWLNLLLLLVVGTVVGRLAGEERDRAERAEAREREARALFRVSFSLADRRDMTKALSNVSATVLDATRMTRVWVVLGETIAADTASEGAAAATPSVHVVLRRRPGDEPADWIRVHAPTRGQASMPDRPETAYRIAIASGDRSFGSLWGLRSRLLGDPDAGETRVLAAAADQLGGSLELDRLTREATSAEISRRSEALKSALLDSVSHDLRTPLASIRAAAGTLMDPEVEWPAAQRREIASTIDREADWLNRLVTNLLDMSRIEAGELQPTLRVFDLADVVDQAVARSLPGYPADRLQIDLAPDLPPILVDEVFIGQALVNVLDNALKYAGPTPDIRISARSLPDGLVRISIVDSGPGVPPESIGRLFDKFYRVPRKGEGSRRGTGIGLSVVRGLVEGMGGRIGARQDPLGGLAIDIDVRSAPTMVAG